MVCIITNVCKQKPWIFRGCPNRAHRQVFVYTTTLTAPSVLPRFIVAEAIILTFLDRHTSLPGIIMSRFLLGLRKVTFGDNLGEPPSSNSRVCTLPRSWEILVPHWISRQMPPPRRNNPKSRLEVLPSGSIPLLTKAYGQAPLAFHVWETA